MFEYLHPRQTTVTYSTHQAPPLSSPLVASLLAVGFCVAAQESLYNTDLYTDPAAGVEAALAAIMADPKAHPFR